MEETFARASDNDREWMVSILDAAQTAGDQPAAAAAMLARTQAFAPHGDAGARQRRLAGWNRLLAATE